MPSSESPKTIDTSGVLALVIAVAALGATLWALCSTFGSQNLYADVGVVPAVAATTGDTAPMPVPPQPPRPRIAP